MRKYRPDLIETVMECLRPELVRVGVINQRFRDKTELVEPWYGSAYNAHKIDPELIETWRLARPVPELHLPLPNEFIPTDFAIVPRLEGEEATPNTPVLISVRG